MEGRLKRRLLESQPRILEVNISIAEQAAKCERTAELAIQLADNSIEGQVDAPPFPMNNWSMNTATEFNATELNKELQDAVVRAMSGVRDDGMGRRAREDMDRMREETRLRIGTVEVAVDLIRDARDQ
jgi:hypothetical protein